MHCVTVLGLRQTLAMSIFCCTSRNELFATFGRGAETDFVDTVCISLVFTPSQSIVILELRSSWDVSFRKKS